MWECIGRESTKNNWQYDKALSGKWDKIRENFNIKSIWQASCSLWKKENETVETYCAKWTAGGLKLEEVMSIMTQ